MLWRMPVDTRTRGSAACSTLGLRPSYPAFVSAKRKTHPASPSTRTVCLVARRPILAVVSIRQRIRRMIRPRLLAMDLDRPRHLSRRRRLLYLSLPEIWRAKACEVGVIAEAIGEPRPRIAWKVGIYV